MGQTREAARLEVLDIDPGDGGVFGGRSLSTDWAEAFRPRAERAKRLKRKLGLRFEWPADQQRRDWVDPASPEPKPPPWVDAIAPADDTRHPALVRVRLELGKQGPRLTAFEVRAGGDGELTPALRRMGLRWLVEDIDAVLAHDYDVGRILGSAWRRTIARPGRAGRPDVVYAERAQRYVEALKADPEAPVKYLSQAAEKAGGWETPEMWRAWLNRARRRGLLTKAPTGKAGGQLTAKAKRLLRVKVREGGRKG